MRARSRPRSLPVACALAFVVGCAHGALGRTPEGGANGAASTRRFVSPYSYEQFARAEIAFARGEYAAAAEGYREALVDQDDPLVFARLAEALDHAGDRTHADEAIEEGLAVDPSSEAVWLARGAILERRGDDEGAFDAYAHATEGAPDSPAGTLAAAQLLSTRGHDERARAILARLAARAAAGSGAAARVALERALVAGDAETLVGAVIAWMRAGPVDAATVQRAARALVAAKRDAFALRLLAGLPEDARDPALTLRAFVETARYDEAAELLAREPPDRFGGALDVAERYLEIGRPDDALAALDSASPEDAPRALLLRGEADLALDRWHDAARLFAGVPAASLHRARALAGLAMTLRAQSLDALATEVAAVGRDANGRAPQ